ncbi:MAG: GTP-binding protein [Clostridia bacterium]|nr:GTP-binding protein [Clostridia bacterium]
MTKIDIFSGFLGAGKTTLIKKLLDGGFGTDKLVLIENEFGEIGIDGAFLKESGINITEMNSGCICCSLVGDFGEALKKVLKEFNPDRILIEPSGVGKLSDVINAVEDIGNVSLVLNSATAVVDAKKCKMYMKNFGEFFNNQVETAKCIVLSHTDGLSEEKLHECMHLLKDKNPQAVIVSTPWDKLTATQIVNAIEGASSIEKEIKELEEDACPVCGHHHSHHHEHHDHGCCGHDHDHHHDHDTVHETAHDEAHHCHHHDEHCSCNHEHHHHDHHDHHDGDCCCGHDHDHSHHHHHADEVFQSVGIETAKVFTKAEIENILSALGNEEKFGTVLRAKGYVASNDEWIYFDYIPGTPDVRCGSADITGRICVIGANINIDAIKELFGA